MSAGAGEQVAAPGRLRILVVTQYFWPENFQINHLTRALQARGHDVTVLTGKPNYPGGTFFDGYSMLGRGRDDFHGMPVVRAPLIARGSGSRWRLALNYFSFAVSGALVGLARLKGPYDCIFVYEPSPITVGIPARAMRWKTGAPILFWVQDLWPESVIAAGGPRSAMLHAVLDRLVRFIYRGCARVLVQSRAFEAPVAAAGVARDRIVYWPQSVDPLFRPVPPITDVPSSLQAPGFRIMFAGNIGEAQDFETVLGAAERLRDHPDIRWIVVGDGRRYDWLKSEVSRRGLSQQVHLLGRFPEEAMPGLFAHADALMVTLRKEPIFALTIPTKVQAYMASGEPIVAALEGEAARIIEESGAGFAAPPGDPAGLAEAVMRMHRQSPEQRAAMGRQGLDYSRRNFDREILLDGLVDLMRATASEAKSAGRSAREYARSNYVK